MVEDDQDNEEGPVGDEEADAEAEEAVEAA